MAKPDWLRVLLCPWRHGDHRWTESGLPVNLKNQNTEWVLKNTWCPNCGKVKWRK